jgi:hypothetical protein
MIVDQVMPEIEKKIETEVDEIIKCELKNLYLKLSISKKKEKKKKKKKKKGKKGKKGKIPGAKMVGARPHKDLLCECAKKLILKKLKPAKMKDFLGEHNLLRTIQEA